MVVGRAIGSASVREAIGALLNALGVTSFCDPKGAQETGYWGRFLLRVYDNTVNSRALKDCRHRAIQHLLGTSLSQTLF